VQYTYTGSLFKLARAVLPAIAILVFAQAVDAGGSRETVREITLYSGRGESLVAPLISRFEEDTGIKVNVRYAGTAELAVLLQEEGDRSPADLFWAQDAGALGSLAQGGLLRPLSAELTAGIPEIYRNSTGEWVATSGRARVLAYHPQGMGEAPMPGSVFDLTRSEYAGRVGWAPTNASFQSFVSAMRVVHGEETTRRWLEEMLANDTQAYRNNTAIVEALGAGEIDLGITNNYYLLRFLETDPSFPVRQQFFDPGDIGNLVNVAGVGVLRSTGNPEDAEQFLSFLLDTEAQQFFTSEVYEYPVFDSVKENPRLEPLSRLLEISPEINLDGLHDLEGTLRLLRLAGLL
jgi:iron(III) transport system substrate-binding protein